jgi:hypothetical protein
MATNQYYGALGSNTVVLSGTYSAGAGINGISNNYATLSAAIQNIQGSGLGGPLQALLEWEITLGSGTITANTGLSVYFIKSQDGGSSYETCTAGSSPVLPNRAWPDYIIPVPPNTTQVIGSAIVIVPAGYFEVFLYINGIGVALAASGNEIWLTPIPVQSV